MFIQNKQEKQQVLHSVCRVPHILHRYYPLIRILYIAFYTNHIIFKLFVYLFVGDIQTTDWITCASHYTEERRQQVH